jgi:hypothetical protein
VSGPQGPAGPAGILYTAAHTVNRLQR